jgi:hypothetical protein
MYIKNKRFAAILLSLSLLLILGLLLIGAIISKPSFIEDEGGMYPDSSAVRLTNTWVSEMLIRTTTARAPRMLTPTANSP